MAYVEYWDPFPWFKATDAECEAEHRRRARLERKAQKARKGGKKKC